MIQTLFHKTIKTIRTDNGIEFVCLKRYFEGQGILHQTSITGTLQQVCIVISLMWSVSIVISLMWLMLYGSKQVCLLSFGQMCISVLLNGKTPFEMLHNKIPPYTNKNFLLFSVCSSSLFT